MEFMRIALQEHGDGRAGEEACRGSEFAEVDHDQCFE